MDIAKQVQKEQQVQRTCETFGVPTIPERRCADYKPNIWNYDAIQSLTNNYNGKALEKQINKLKEEAAQMLSDAADQTTKLKMVNCIEKLGLANLFAREIKAALDAIYISNDPKDLHDVALRFRLLRQHGYNVSQDVFNNFLDESKKFSINGRRPNIGGVIELFEASHLRLEGESVLDEAKAFSSAYLRGLRPHLEGHIAQQVGHALELAHHWRVQWFDVKWNINAYEKREDANLVLLRLAKINFNMVQATHQENLGEVCRWWKNMGLVRTLSFTRDRLVESFLWAVGVAFEPEHECLRKWLTKAINLVLVIDDVYDVYGSLQELEIFTHAVDKWDTDAIQLLPECMKICFHGLSETIIEVANEIQKEQGGRSVLSHLQKAWADFCKALLVEAKWYNMGHTPTLREYLNNGCISSCGPLLHVHAFLYLRYYKDESLKEEAEDILERNQDVVLLSSLIIRLSNDLGTSTAELERGDAASSILCYMREANVSEDVARKYIKEVIVSTWKKINGQYCLRSVDQQPVDDMVRIATNVARVAHCIYQHGDGFGVQDRETKEQVLSLLIKPLALE